MVAVPTGVARLLVLALCVGLVSVADADARAGARDPGFGGGDGLVTDPVHRPGGFSVADAIVRADGRVHVLALPGGAAEVATYDRRGRRVRLARLPAGQHAGGALVETSRGAVAGYPARDGLRLVRIDRFGRAQDVGVVARASRLLAGAADGAVMVQGRRGTGRRKYAVLERILPTGRRDPRWRAARIPLDVEAAVVPGTRRVVVAGLSPGLVRLFDGTGKRRWTVKAPETARDGNQASVVADRRGRVVVVATGLANSPRAYRLLANGRLDRSWGAPGGTQLYGRLASTGRLRLDSAGRLLISGHDDAGLRGAVIRLGHRGNVDGTFGRGGVVLMPGTEEDASIVHDARSIGRRIVAAGYRLTGGGFREDFGDPGTVLIARLLRDYIR